MAGGQTQVGEPQVGTKERFSALGAQEELAKVSLASDS